MASAVEVRQSDQQAEAVKAQAVRQARGATVRVGKTPVVTVPEGNVDHFGKGHRVVEVEKDIKEEVASVVDGWLSSDDDMTVDELAQVLQLARKCMTAQLKAKVRVLQSAVVVRANRKLRRKLRQVTVVESSSDSTSETEDSVALATDRGGARKRKPSKKAKAGTAKLLRV